MILISLNSIIDYVFFWTMVLVFSFQLKPLSKTPGYLCLHLLDLNSFDNKKIRHSYVCSEINQRFLRLTNV